MDKDIFVQNIKKYCERKGIKPTTACKECGVGGSFINDIERGRRPLITKVQTLAHYLGVSTSQLLGETTTESLPTPEVLPQSETALLQLFRQLNEEGQERFLNYGDDLVETGKYKKSSTSRLAQGQA